ncbi:FtsX-like permease family protein [Candidatus Bathyarchaeota archaeon]|nr:MAG: FtsX-like permease family protein [Candidatus Bathyarchaeota archaeon]
MSGAVGEAKREVKFPFSEAVRFSIESIRKRFTRALITAISIVLGVAFYVGLRTMSDIMIFIYGSSEAAKSYQFWMAIISLIVCAVGILNSMLMAVTERTREIGTMKCLGAMDSHILMIFLIESSLIGIIGGIIGAVIGWISGLLIYVGEHAAILFSPALLGSYAMRIGEGVLIAMVLTVGATIYPAYYAASMDPADALRFEL